MEKFIINGGKPLGGEVEARGAKNAAFPLLVASLLTDQECRISNLPLIEDVFRIIEILKGMGAEVDFEGERTIRIRTRDVDPSRMKKDLVLLLRGSVLLLGPLLARFQKVRIPRPGGCIIGVRPIDTHLDAFRQLGVETSSWRDQFELTRGKTFPGEMKAVLNEFSVTATENLMLFASLIPSKTVIRTADQDYQVQELGRFLQKMGVKITGLGTHNITVYGARKLKGAEHTLMYDPPEAGTFILTAAVNKGEVLVKNVELSFLELSLKKLKDFGVPLEIIYRQKNRGEVKVFPWKSLKMDRIQSLPYPGIPSDLQSAFGVLATQSPGSTLIHDPLYEGRLKYLEELTKMGAEIYFADPHRAIVNGPTPLYGQEIKSLDLRGGAALIIAGLIAQGETTIENIYQIDRGYEKIEERLQGMGAEIKRVKN